MPFQFSPDSFLIYSLHNQVWPLGSTSAHLDRMWHVGNKSTSVKDEVIWSYFPICFLISNKAGISVKIGICYPFIPLDFDFKKENHSFLSSHNFQICFVQRVLADYSKLYTTSH